MAMLPQLTAANHELIELMRELPRVMHERTVHQLCTRPKLKAHVDMEAMLQQTDPADTLMLVYLPNRAHGNSWILQFYAALMRFLRAFEKERKFVLPLRFYYSSESFLQWPAEVHVKMLHGLFVFPPVHSIASRSSTRALRYRYTVDEYSRSVFVEDGADVIPDTEARANAPTVTRVLSWIREASASEGVTRLANMLSNVRVPADLDDRCLLVEKLYRLAGLPKDQEVQNPPRFQRIRAQLMAKTAAAVSEQAAAAATVPAASPSSPLTFDQSFASFKRRSRSQLDPLCKLEEVDLVWVTALLPAMQQFDEIMQRRNV